jgi:hypothetical protein
MNTQFIQSFFRFGITHLWHTSQPIYIGWEWNYYLIKSIQHEEECMLVETCSCLIWIHNLFFSLWCCGLMWAMDSSFLRFLDHTHRRTTVSRTPLDEWSAHQRGLYLTTHNNHNRQTWFRSTISVGELPQTYARPVGPANAFWPNYNYVVCAVLINTWCAWFRMFEIKF